MSVNDDGGRVDLCADEVGRPVAASAAVCRHIAVAPVAETVQAIMLVKAVFMQGVSRRDLRKAKLVVDSQSKLIALILVLRWQQRETVLGLATVDDIGGQGRVLALADEVLGVIAGELEVDVGDRAVGLVLADGEVGNVDVLVPLRVGALGKGGSESCEKGGECGLHGDGDVVLWDVCVVICLCCFACWMMMDYSSGGRALI